jgi:hypothetical protein
MECDSSALPWSTIWSRWAQPPIWWDGLWLGLRVTRGSHCKGSTKHVVIQILEFRSTQFCVLEKKIVDVHWRLHTFALSRCTCYVFIFPGAAYNVNLCNLPGSHMRNCNIFSYLQLLVHHSLEIRIQLWSRKTVVLYSPTSKFLIFG